MNILPENPSQKSFFISTIPCPVTYCLQIQNCTDGKVQVQEVYVLFCVTMRPLVLAAGDLGGINIHSLITCSREGIGMKVMRMTICQGVSVNPR